MAESSQCSVHATRAAQGTNSNRASFDLFKNLSIWFINDNHLPWKIHDESFDSRKSKGTTLDCTHLKLRGWFSRESEMSSSSLGSPWETGLHETGTSIFRKKSSAVFPRSFGMSIACPCGKPGVEWLQTSRSRCWRSRGWHHNDDTPSRSIWRDSSGELRAMTSWGPTMPFDS